MLQKLLSAIFANTLIIYIISEYIFILGFTITFHYCSLEMFLIIGAIFWILDTFAKRIFKILTLPLNFITLGIFGILVNVLFIYLFQYIINTNISHIATIELGTFIQVFLVSILIYLLNLIFKKL